jgi:tubulin polyglutamylase TTLL6/13
VSLNFPLCPVCKVRILILMFGIFVFRRISTINRYLRDKGYDVDKMWADIDDVITKTLISAHSILKHNYRTCFPNHVKGSACFEILGFDVLLDRKLRPQVLEVRKTTASRSLHSMDKQCIQKGFL